jgi:hypothetical protein
MAVDRAQIVEHLARGTINHYPRTEKDGTLRGTLTKCVTYSTTAPLAHPAVFRLATSVLRFPSAGLTSSTPAASDPNQSIVSYRVGAVNGINMRGGSQAFLGLSGSSFSSAKSQLPICVFGMLVGVGLFG